MADTSTYWATQPPDEFSREAWAKVRSYYDATRGNSHFTRIAKAYKATFGVSGRDGVSWELTRDGKQGQYVRLQGGDFRNLGEHRVTIATAVKPAWQPVATNSDHSSLAQASVVSGVLDYYWRERRIVRHLRRAMKDIQWAGEGFVFGGWDSTLGETVGGDPETGEEVKEGDIWFSTPTIFDVVRDINASAWSSTRWRFVREFVNKWDLAARFPEKAEEIRTLKQDEFDSVRRYAPNAADTDEVAIFHFLHDRCPAVPGGAYAVIASENLLLLPPGPMPYRSSPLVRLVEDELVGTPFGYSALWDALGTLEASDKLTAAILTQQMAHAVAKIIGVKGSGLNHKQIAEGLAYLEVNSMDQRPQSLDLAPVNPQVFEFRSTLKAEAQRLANLNEVAMGVASNNIKSGQHAALYDAIAQRGANALQEAYFAASEDLGTFVLHALADYAGDSERTARLVGEQNRPLLYTFTGRDLEGFERVVVEAADHSNKTPIGKRAIADALLERGALGGPSDPLVAQKYLALVKTGELQQMTEAPEAQRMRIKRDKELLAKGIGPVPRQPVVDPMTGAPALDPMGKPVMEPGMPEPGRQYLAVLAADPHWLDIPEYLAVLSSPEARENPEVVQAVTEAVLQKLDAWRHMDPDLLSILGGPPPPSMTGGTPPPTPGDGSGTPPPEAGAAGGTGAPQDNLPTPSSPPKNPASGAPYDPESGPEGAQ